MKYMLKDALHYEQPTKYIVKSEEYNDSFSIPVLTAGKSFILGYTNENEGICYASKSPVIIFDDFTADSKYVDFDFKVKSSAMKILHKVTNTDNLKYFFYAMQRINYKPFSHKRVWISEYCNFSISKRSSTEQNYIVNDLDTIQRAIDLKKEAILALDNLIKSRFIEMFGDPNTNPFGFEQSTIGEVCSSIVRGPFGSALKKEYFVPQSENTYKVYEQKHAIQRSFTIGTYYITEEKYKELKRFECMAGDIIMSCSGTMGKLYQLPVGCEKGIINQALCKFTLNEKILPIVFLTYMQQTIDNLETKGSGIQNIAAVTYVKAMPINLPPISLQNEFADFVKQIDKLKFIVQKQIDNLQELLDSKMDEYFG